jgi:tRNA threonylcarbamoyladenosine biosynthesis protein TsaB
VASPTFTLVRHYEGRLPVRHIDLYRLDPQDLDDLDWRELFYGEAVSVVEWADKAAEVLPRRRYRVHITPVPGGDPDRRRVEIAGPPDVSRERSRPAPARAAAEAEPGQAGAGAAAHGRLWRGPLPSAAGPGPGCILGLDTSTEARSLALLSAGEVVELTWDPHGGLVPAEDLSGAVRELLALAGRDLADLELVAAAVGPGSFTGVKVGLAAAKALAYALGCPVLGVSTLDVLAAGALARAPAALVLVDAKRGEVFGAAYGPEPEALPLPDHGGLRRVVGPVEEVLRSLAAALRDLPGAAVSVVGVAGTGALLYREEVSRAVEGLGAVWDRARCAASGGPVPAPVHPRARDLVVLARKRFAARARGDDPFALVPDYLKQPQLGPPSPGGRPLEGDGR